MHPGKIEVLRIFSGGIRFAGAVTDREVPDTKKRRNADTSGVNWGFMYDNVLDLSC